MKTGILFDLDGTLLDTLDDLTDATNHILHQFGYPQRSREEIRRFVGNGARRQLEQSAPEGADIDRMLSEYQIYYAANCQNKTGPYAGIPELLDRLAGQYALAIVTNKPDRAVKPLCSKWFPGLFAMGEHSGCPRKPAPDMVWETMKAIGVDRCVYVGDSEVDVLTARNAGVPCLSVLWGFRDRETIAAAGGEYFCSTPEELPDVLQRILSDKEFKNGK